MEIPLEKITDNITQKAQVNLFVLRLDKSHLFISGNKWFKLKHNVEEVKKQRADGIITFGGAFSNHIAAVAAAGKEFRIRTVGIIRGDELEGEENSTLRFVKECGMKLFFVPREEYRNKSSSQLINSITQQFTNFYLLPEGGTNELAVKGCAEITSLIKIPFDFICCAVGTGGTIAGIISSLKENQKAIGFAVLKGEGYHQKEIERLLSGFQIDTLTHFHINENYHFGGYARHTPELLKFISDFEIQNKIPLDHVYTGKMMSGIYDLMKKNRFPKNSTVIAIHTGGLH